MVINNQQNPQKMSDDAVLIDIVNRLIYYKDKESKTYVDIKGTSGKVSFVETESPQLESISKQQFDGGVAVPHLNLRKKFNFYFGVYYVK